MKIKFDEAIRINNKLVLSKKLKKAFDEIYKEFVNSSSKQKVSIDIIDTIRDINYYYYNKCKINKLETEKLVIFDNFYLEKKLKNIKYWFWRDNKKINIVLYKELFKWVDKLINISENFDDLNSLFKEKEVSENKAYSNVFFELFIILNNYNKFVKNTDFNKNWYLKIIFKELFSLIDKTIFDYCCFWSFKNIGAKLELITNNYSLKYIFMEFLPRKSDKWNLIFIDKYNHENNKIILKNIKNLELKEIEFDEAWIEINKLRNDLEHVVTNNLINLSLKKDSKLIEQINLEYSIKYLIGLNIYIINKLNIETLKLLIT